MPVGKIDPDAMAQAVNLRRNRLRRHNLLVKEIARRFGNGGLDLYEGRFDCLASAQLVGILNEVKTLDGTSTDEATQVRDALGQLLYYEPFVKKEMGEGVIHKVAVFESPITDAHIQLMQSHGIVCLWKHDGQFVGGPGADELLGRYFEELK